MRKPGTLIAAVIFAVGAIAHLVRLLFAVEIQIGDWSIPMWLSMFGILIAVVLSAVLFKERLND